jgi:hypothetical protein
MNFGRWTPPLPAIVGDSFVQAPEVPPSNSLRVENLIDSLEAEISLARFFWGMAMSDNTANFEAKSPKRSTVNLKTVPSASD